LRWRPSRSLQLRGGPVGPDRRPPRGRTVGALNRAMRTGRRGPGGRLSFAATYVVDSPLPVRERTATASRVCVRLDVAPL
jgi:hypothetical protein